MRARQCTAESGANRDLTLTDNKIKRSDQFLLLYLTKTIMQTCGITEAVLYKPV